MRQKNLLGTAVLLLILVCLPVFLSAQGKLADYERASALRDKVEGLALNVMGRVTWIDMTSRFWYRKTVQGGSEFEVVDAATLTKKPAFDHAKLAASLSAAAGEKYTGLKLPFMAINFVDNEKAIEFDVGDSRWKCDLSDYSCKKTGPAERRGRFGGGGGLGQ